MNSPQQRRFATRLGEAAVVFLTLALLAELLLPAYTNGERTLDGLLQTTVVSWTRKLSLLTSLVCGLAWLLFAQRDWVAQIRHEPLPHLLPFFAAPFFAPFAVPSRPYN